MVIALYALVGIAVVVVIAVLAVGRLGELPAAPLDRAPLALPVSGISADDVDQVRFGVGLRGYRMDEVDVVLERVADDIARRDERISQLEGTLANAGVPIPAEVLSPLPVPAQDEAAITDDTPSAPADAATTESDA